MNRLEWLQQASLGLKRLATELIQSDDDESAVLALAARENISALHNQLSDRANGDAEFVPPPVPTLPGVPMYKLTKLNADLSVAADQSITDHPILHLERRIYGHAVAILFATIAPPKDLNWKGANDWCRERRVGGFEDWEATSPEGAQLLLDRSSTTWPLVTASHLPNHAGKWIWTNAEDLTPPAGHAFVVSLDDGYAGVDEQWYLYGALACRPGQSFGPGPVVTP